jgi:hypothetical protein
MIPCVSNVHIPGHVNGNRFRAVKLRSDAHAVRKPLSARARKREHLSLGQPFIFGVRPPKLVRLGWVVRLAPAANGARGKVCGVVLQTRAALHKQAHFVRVSKVIPVCDIWSQGEGGIGDGGDVGRELRPQNPLQLHVARPCVDARSANEFLAPMTNRLCTSCRTNVPKVLLVADGAAFQFENLRWRLAIRKRPGRKHKNASISTAARRKRQFH